METRTTSRRGALAALGVGASLLAGVPAVMAAKAEAAPGNDPKWIDLVADYRAKRAEWLRTVDLYEIACDASQEAIASLRPQPVQPDTGFDKDWPLSQIVNATKDPAYMAAWAAYEQEDAAGKAERDALKGQIEGPAKAAYHEALDADDDAFEALVAYRATSHAVLSEKIEIIASHHDGDDITAKHFAAIAADVRHLGGEA